MSLPLSLPLAEIYPQALSTFIEQGIHYELLDDAMAVDLERLGAALKPERDHQFGFLGLPYRLLNVMAPSLDSTPAKSVLP